MLDAVNRHNLASQGCGICEKKESDVFWFSQFSYFSHVKCHQNIQAISDNLLKAIDATYQDSHQKTMAHIRAVGGIRRACGSDSISAYLEKNGPVALRRLFDTVGVYCANVAQSRL